MLPDTEGLHTIASTDSSDIAASPGGGAVAIRGFYAQTVVALLEVAAAQPPFTEITMEPPQGNDQFDFIWGDGAKSYASQVKSSKNAFKPADVKEWAEKLERESKTEACSLILVGSIGSNLDGLDQHGRVAIKKVNPHLIDLEKQAAHDLATFLHHEKLPQGSPDERILYVQALIANLMRLSTKLERLTRSELRQLLRKWLKDEDEDSSGKLVRNG